MAEIAFDLDYDADLGGNAEVSGEAAAPSPLFSLHVPIPVSTNALFRNAGKKGRVKTKEYKDWESQAMWMTYQAKQQHKITKPFLRDFGLVIEVDRPSRRRDLDNCLKGAIDLLPKCEIINDDNQLAFIMVCWRPKPPKGVRCMAKLQLYDAATSPMVAFIPNSTGYGAAGAFMTN